jgi:catalase
MEFENSGNDRRTGNSWDYYMNRSDVTKVWPNADYPLIDVGVLELNQNLHNYFQDIEQAAFAPAHIVDGIGYSPDRMLPEFCRILMHNAIVWDYEQIPVNRCPFATNNYQRDGQSARTEMEGKRTSSE